MTTTLMPMGGALDERKDPTVLQEFLRRAGGKKARIVILPQASARRDTGIEYVELFKSFGAKEALSFEFRQRSEAGTAEQIKLIRKASGIFFSGGTQMRIAAVMGGTALEAEIHVAYRRGCIVGGTSAGASILSKTMIAYGNGGPTPRERIIQFSAGLGFTDKFIFDQHFRQRRPDAGALAGRCTWQSARDTLFASITGCRRRFRSGSRNTCAHAGQSL